MNRGRRIAAIVVALLGVVGVAIWLLPLPLLLSVWKADKPAAAVADTTRRGSTIAPAATTDATDTSASRMPAATPITPEEFAKAWQARALKTIRNKNARLLGEEVADLLALPADKAWSALTRRAHDGDEAATTAALALAEACQNLRAWNAGEGRGAPLYAMTHASRMDALWRLQRQWSLERGNDCAKITDAAEFARFATDRFVRDDDPSTLRDAATSIDDEVTAIAAMRSLTATDDSDDLRHALAARLWSSADPQRRAEGDAMLDALARKGDLEALELLGLCHDTNCEHPAMQEWRQRAAGLGAWNVLGRQIDAFTNLHDPTSAWAWAQYRAVLAQDACFEHLEPSTTWLAEALRAANHLQDSLSTAQRAEGEILLRQLLAQWSSQAHAAQGCG